MTSITCPKKPPAVPNSAMPPVPRTNSMSPAAIASSSCIVPERPRVNAGCCDGTGSSALTCTLGRGCCWACAAMGGGATKALSACCGAAMVATTACCNCNGAAATAHGCTTMAALAESAPLPDANDDEVLFSRSMTCLEFLRPTVKPGASPWESTGGVREPEDLFEEPDLVLAVGEGIVARFCFLPSSPPRSTSAQCAAELAAVLALPRFGQPARMSETACLSDMAKEQEGAGCGSQGRPSVPPTES
mmetsp:Transcript_50349/g.128201  ORF Transcript_50349/g.128201 Transcript_50349/m.128201 type:complete len:247 (+) Transcript_50349:2981-3721(+)